MSYDIFLADPYIDQLEIESVVATLKSGWISQGPKTAEFEQLVANICGSKYAIAMNNGTATLHAALLALNVQPGDTVICPSMSYISTSNAILYCGAKPKFVDVNSRTFNLCPIRTEKAIDNNTKAIIVVDLKGQPVDYLKFAELSKKYNIPILADSAQSFGAEYKGKKVGSQAPIHSFSMFANKNITTGEGGILTTNSEELAHSLRVLRNQGQDGTRYIHNRLGYNYRYNDVLASIGITQLSRIEEILVAKQKIANYYDAKLSNIDSITIPKVENFVTRHSWYHYTISFASINIRDKVRDKLEKSGIETRVAFPPIHLQPMFDGKYVHLKLPNTKLVFETMLDIPCHPKLKDFEIEKIISVIQGALLP